MESLCWILKRKYPDPVLKKSVTPMKIGAQKREVSMSLQIARFRMFRALACGRMT